MDQNMLSLNYYKDPKNFEDNDELFYESDRLGFYQYQKYIENEFEKFKEKYYDQSNRQILGIYLNNDYLEDHMKEILDNKKFIPFSFCYYLVCNYPISRKYVPDIQTKWFYKIGSLYDAASKYNKIGLNRNEKKDVNIALLFDISKFIEWYPEYSDLLIYE